MFPPAVLPELDDPAYRIMRWEPYEWNCSVGRRLENYFDFSHFAHVHHGILGDRDNAVIADYQAWRQGGELRISAGPFLEYTDNPKNATVSVEGDTYEAWKRYRVFMPNAMWLDSSAGPDEHYILFVAVAPVSRKRTRCFTFVARNYGFDEDEEFDRMQRVILAQDKPVVESQRPEELPVELSAEMHVKAADLGTVLYRRWLMEFADGQIELAPTVVTIPASKLPSVVIVGASLGGLRTASALRRLGFHGRITLVGDEPHLPYDRPPLSKEVLTGEKQPDDTFFRTPEFFEGQGIDLRLGSQAVALDGDSRTITFVTGERLDYDAAVIATGARPRRLPGGGAIPGVHVMRTLDDSTAISSSFDDARHLVVVGAGFIGSEVAASARSRGVEVTIIEAADQPLVAAVGAEVGERCAGLHGLYRGRAPMRGGCGRYRGVVGRFSGGPHEWNRGPV